MNATLLYAAAATLAVTAIVHAVLGERRLIRPLLAIDHALVRHPLARPLIRFAWHFTTVLMGLVALVQFRAAAVPAYADRVTLMAIGGALLAVGVLDAAMTKFKHIGWPLLASSGLLTLLAL